jgi:hypothetical protein
MNAGAFCGSIYVRGVKNCLVGCEKVELGSHPISKNWVDQWMFTSQCPGFGPGFDSWDGTHAPEA